MSPTSSLPGNQLSMHSVNNTVNSSEEGVPTRSLVSVGNVKERPKPSLAAALMWAFGRAMLVAGVYELICDFLLFASPQLLK